MAINTWPIDEGYVESENGSPPGIIDGDATYPEISAGLIADLNAREGETSISAGYHVIEFLLWGRDRRADGPGDRTFNDYLASGPARGRSATLARRRGTYLHLATELLVGQLRALAGEWGAERGDNYRATFLRLPPREALARIIKGMGVLGGGELAGERLTVAYETKDQENEHSCFSDNTHNDVLLDARGIQNVYLGRYQRDDGGAVNGPGVYDWVVLADAGLGLRLKIEVAASVAAAGAIPPPFDQAILGNDQQPGRRAIRTTIQALQRQSDTLAEVAAVFDIALNLTAPAGARAGRAGSPAVSALPGRP
jgi:putative iron-regulated protein